MQKLAIYIPGEEVIFTLYDNIQRQCLAICTYTLNNRNLFAITRLLRTRPFTAVRGYNNLCLALYKVLCLSWSNIRYVTFIKKAISHISYVIKS
ncbi:hypothetical protein CT0861_12744 [Colletotrichum tofieldiae]|uniref:Uncharacterized protein n=1 Tax=Colletotrichum tofieldiae TaxID=708197 RepID=A0A166SIA7_9PEZI|nr:hypothetical protein CT0861_12744 [Colletotrichum tofieldiae]